MKEFLKLGLFYWHLSRGKIIIFMIITFIATACEAIFALSLLPLIELGSDSSSKYSTYIYDLLNNYGFHNKDVLLPLLGIALFFIFITSIGQILAKFYTAKLQADMFYTIQMEVSPKMFNCKYSYFISQNMGYLNNAMVQQLAVTAFAFKFYAAVFASGLLSLAYLIVPCFANPLSIVILAIAFMPLLPLLKLFNNKNRYYSTKRVECTAKLNSILLQVMGNFKYIKSTGISDLLLNKVEIEVKNLGQKIKKLSIWSDTSSFVIRPYAIAIIFVMIYYSVNHLNHSFIEAGAMFAFLYMAYQKAVVIPIAYQKFLGSIGAINVYKNLNEAISNNGDEYSKGKKAPQLNQKIEVKNLSFKYNLNQPNVLNNISLTIPNKTSIAIVGGSGSGKSTLVNLITGLIKHQEGDIFFGDNNIDDLDISLLRKSIGYISQEAVIFNDTIDNNISLWSNTASKNEIISSAKKAHAHSFIMEMKNGYDTLLGDNGTNISGGQRQRLSIARELFRNPPIMIFDEATSALDSETESKIQSEIDDLKGERTIIIIAHRLATIKNCDLIYVLENGTIAEKGSYQELYDKKGKFRAMIDQQAL